MTVDPFDVDLERLRARRGAKWHRHGDDVLGAWIAEMDVRPCPPVRAAVLDALETGVDGYPGDDLVPALVHAFAARWSSRFGWSPDPARTRPVASAIGAVRQLLERVTEPGDEVVLPTPGFPPFAALVPALGRRLVTLPAERDGDGWRHDPTRLDARVSDRARLLFVVNPHNPLGVAATRDDLAAWGEAAERHDLLVVSDELHADVTFPGVPHVPTASVAPELAARTVTLASAGKSHDLAGYRCAVLHFGSEELARRFDGPEAPLMGDVSNLGMIATTAAWRDGNEWLDAVRDGVADRRAQLESFLAEQLPEVGVAHANATYLAWLDVSALGLGADPAEFFRERALVATAPGAPYGDGWEQHVRLTIATSSAILEEILERMVTAVDLR